MFNYKFSNGRLSRLTVSVKVVRSATTYLHQRIVNKQTADFCDGSKELLRSLLLNLIFRRFDLEKIRRLEGLQEMQRRAFLLAEHRDFNKCIEFLLILHIILQ